MRVPRKFRGEIKEHSWYIAQSMQQCVLEHFAGNVKPTAFCLSQVLNPLARKCPSLINFTWLHEPTVFCHSGKWACMHFTQLRACLSSLLGGFERYSRLTLLGNRKIQKKVVPLHTFFFALRGLARTFVTHCSRKRDLNSVHGVAMSTGRGIRCIPMHRQTNRAVPTFQLWRNEPRPQLFWLFQEQVRAEPILVNKRSAVCSWAPDLLQKFVVTPACSSCDRAPNLWQIPSLTSSLYDHVTKLAHPERYFWNAVNLWYFFLIYLMVLVDWEKQGWRDFMLTFCKNKQENSLTLAQLISDLYISDDSTM